MKETHVFAEVIEDLAKEQFEEAMLQPFAVKGALMADAHVGNNTLDESPDAYKNIFEVMDLQKDLVKVVHHIKPLINCKG